jgi:hypothetical protein
MWRSRHDSQLGNGLGGPRFRFVSPLQFFGGLQFTRFVRDDLAITLAIDAHKTTGSGAALVRLPKVAVDGLALPVGLRWNPLKGERLQQVKPFIGAAVGPVISALNKVTFASPYEQQVFPETHATTIGGRIGGGFDIHLAQSFSVGIGVDYNAMKVFSRPVGPVPLAQRQTLAGPQVAIAEGWLFGKRNAEGLERDD